MGEGKNRNIIIIGAGLAGLSAAFHLKGSPLTIVEREERAGGLCRSISKEGFTFDYSGHLMSIRSDYTMKFMKGIMDRALLKHKRRAAISWKGILVPYPFQANLRFLPVEVIRECLKGFLDSMIEPFKEGYGWDHRGDILGLDFLSWIRRNFGDGIGRHFLIPYNRKMWGVELESMTADWVDWSIPRPSLEEVIDGILGTLNSPFGYNAEFFYPSKGGIEALSEGMFRNVREFADVLFKREAIKIDTDERTILLNTGESIPYYRIVSTMPLTRLINITSGLPLWVKDEALKLRSTGVMVFNVGISHPSKTDLHWIYYPEEKYPFFRAGIYSNFSRNLVPYGCSSLYAEVSYLPNFRPEKEVLTRQVMDGLMDAGLLSREGDIVQMSILEIEPAYVIFDRHRREKLPYLLRELEKNGIYSIGRYGSWGYMTMEDSILQGKEIAGRLK